MDRSKSEAEEEVVVEITAPFLSISWLEARAPRGSISALCWLTSVVNEINLSPFITMSAWRGYVINNDLSLLWSVGSVRNDLVVAMILLKGLTTPHGELLLSTFIA